MPGPRYLEPEWLDTLPQDDPGAIRSRRDLRRLNAWMFQTGIMRRLVAFLAERGALGTIVDLGAGDGTFLLGLARRMAPAGPAMRAILVDRQNLVTPETRAGFEALGWRAEPVAVDVFEYLDRVQSGSADLVIANLFLHHFPDDDLAHLFDLAARLTPRFAACEPRRGPLALAASRSVWMLGCNRVTRHDAVVSVRAGFRGTELSGHWPTSRGWHLREYPAGPFTHCFAAHHGD